MLAIFGFSEVVQLRPGLPSSQEMRLMDETGKMYSVSVSPQLVQDILRIFAGHKDSDTVVTPPAPKTVALSQITEEPSEPDIGELATNVNDTSRPAATVDADDAGYPVKRNRGQTKLPVPAFATEDDDGEQI